MLNLIHFIAVVSIAFCPLATYASDLHDIKKLNEGLRGFADGFLKQFDGAKKAVDKNKDIAVYQKQMTQKLNDMRRLVHAMQKIEFGKDFLLKNNEFKRVDDLQNSTTRFQILNLLEQAIEKNTFKYVIQSQEGRNYIEKALNAIVNYAPDIGEFEDVMQGKTLADSYIQLGGYQQGLERMVAAAKEGKIIAPRHLLEDQKSFPFTTIQDQLDFMKENSWSLKDQATFFQLASIFYHYNDRKSEAEARHQLSLLVRNSGITHINLSRYRGSDGDFYRIPFIGSGILMVKFVEQYKKYNLKDFLKALCILELERLEAVYKDPTLLKKNVDLRESLSRYKHTVLLCDKLGCVDAKDNLIFQLDERINAVPTRSDNNRKTERKMAENKQIKQEIKKKVIRKNVALISVIPSKINQDLIEWWQSLPSGKYSKDYVDKQYEYILNTLDNNENLQMLYDMLYTYHTIKKSEIHRKIVQQWDKKRSSVPLIYDQYKDLVLKSQSDKEFIANLLNEGIIKPTLKEKDKKTDTAWPQLTNEYTSTNDNNSLLTSTISTSGFSVDSLKAKTGEPLYSNNSTNSLEMEKKYQTTSMKPLLPDNELQVKIAVLQLQAAHDYNRGYDDRHSFEAGSTKKFSQSKTTFDELHRLGAGMPTLFEQKRDIDGKQVSQKVYKIVLLGDISEEQLRNYAELGEGDVLKGFCKNVSDGIDLNIKLYTAQINKYEQDPSTVSKEKLLNFIKKYKNNLNMCIYIQGDQESYRTALDKCNDWIKILSEEATGVGFEVSEKSQNKIKKDSITKKKKDSASKEGLTDNSENSALGNDDNEVAVYREIEELYEQQRHEEEKLQRELQDRDNKAIEDKPIGFMNALKILGTGFGNFAKAVVQPFVGFFKSVGSFFSRFAFWR